MANHRRHVNSLHHDYERQCIHFYLEYLKGKRLIQITVSLAASVVYEFEITCQYNKNVCPLRAINENSVDTCSLYETVSFLLNLKTKDCT